MNIRIIKTMDILFLVAIVTQIVCIVVATINDDTYRVERVYDKKYVNNNRHDERRHDGYDDDNDGKHGDDYKEDRKGGRYYYGGKYSGKLINKLSDIHVDNVMSP